MAIAYTKYIKLSNFSGTQASINAPYNSVTFFLTPEISESRSVNYLEIGDIRLPASILIYMGSPSRSFNISAKFMARSQAEADVAFRNKSLLESWCVTNSGLSGDNIGSAVTKTNNQLGNPDVVNPGDTATVAQQDGFIPGISALPTKSQVSNQPPQTFTASTDLFAQSPPVLALEGYAGQFRKIPIVIRSLNISYPSDVDYIAGSNGVMVPILQDISIQLQEARNISGGKGAIDKFRLKEFKQGTLQYW